MAVTVSGEGSWTCTINDEHTIITFTTAGVYIVTLDVTALAAGDSLTVRAKNKILTAGTAKVMYTAVYTGIQDDPCVSSVPLPIGYGGSVTIEQTTGTGRGIPWHYLSLT